MGVYYQYGDGWKTSNNDMSIDWSLVDIVGLVAERTYLPPTTLPTTLEGWISSVAAQLGDNFKSRYHVDPDYAKKPVKAKDKLAVTGKKCGDILRWACMVTGTFPRADAETGYLTAEPLWNQGNKTLLTALADYPTMKANKSVASLIFTLADGTQYVVSGNSTSSEKTINIENPFIHTSAEALTAARLILSCYGGNLIETTGRGDPSGEIGDVDTIWLDESSATTARRMMQTFKIQDGALQGCQSRLLQADGSFLFQERAVVTKSGSWTAPAGVTALRLILVGKGEDGTAGTDGTWDEAGADGVDGRGALSGPGRYRSIRSSRSVSRSGTTLFLGNTAAQMAAVSRLAIRTLQAVTVLHGPGSKSPSPALEMVARRAWAGSRATAIESQAMIPKGIRSAHTGRSTTILERAPQGRLEYPAAS